MAELLRVDNLTVGYGDAIAVDNISFSIARSEFVTFIGPNGAGKTTLLNSLIGVLSPKAGAITFDGEELRELRPEARVGRGMVIVPERRELFAGLSVEDNLRLGAFLRPRSDVLRPTPAPRPSPVPSPGRRRPSHSG